MDLTLLPSKKTVAQWSDSVLIIAQGNSVIELTPDQAFALFDLIRLSATRSVQVERKPEDLGI